MLINLSPGKLPGKGGRTSRRILPVAPRPAGRSERQVRAVDGGLAVMTCSHVRTPHESRAASSAFRNPKLESHQHPLVSLSSISIDPPWPRAPTWNLQLTRVRRSGSPWVAMVRGIQRGYPHATFRGSRLGEIVQCSGREPESRRLRISANNQSVQTQQSHSLSRRWTQHRRNRRGRWSRRQSQADSARRW